MVFLYISKMKKDKQFCTLKKYCTIFSDTHRSTITIHSGNAQTTSQFDRKGHQGKMSVDFSFFFFG